MVFLGTTRFKILVIFTVGLFVSQVLSFIHVYLSNIVYQDTLAAITHAGYLAVPSQVAASELKTFFAAFNGGLFFTLTIGLCLIVLSFLFAWLLYRLPVRSTLTFILPFVVWLFCLVYTNLEGFSSLVFFQFFVIPPITFILSMKVLLHHREKQTGKNPTMHMAIFTAFAIFTASSADMNIFLDIRDGLLLNTPVGRSINAFYYDNSLYAARVFKSPGQRLLKTCDLNSEIPIFLKKKIIKRLLLHDYIPVESNVTPDLYIEKNGEELEFKCRDSLVTKSSIEDFLEKHTAVLNHFEQESDHHGFFRRFTMFSILFIGVLIIFLVLYLPFYFLLKKFISLKKACLIAGALCIFSGWFFSTQFLGGYQVNDENLMEIFESSDVDSRVAALKYIHRNHIGISVFQFYPDITKTDNIAERYWFTKILRDRRGPLVRKTLVKLLDDPHFNVVCMAFHALGYTGSKKNITEIIKRIKTSDNWYEQWYAYKAMRRLGWKQKRLE
ncbi:MAG: HEAT repeat domain-containing protein [Deltaproteobacteria bacterium]|nr:HEAT repeat domain-containing protein [Deltaproteobacteria bacterium]